MRLRYIETVSFGKSELTNWRNILATHPEFGKADSAHKLHPDDVVCLVSVTGNQLIFLHNFDHLDGKTILRSSRFRITGRSTWEPLMLANYAKQVGLVLQGLKTFEDHINAVETTRARARTS